MAEFSEAMEKLTGCPGITTITRFLLPLNQAVLNSSNYEDDNGRIVERWRPLINLVMKDEGHYVTRACRSDEKLEEVITITDWESSAHLHRFRSSPAGVQYRHFLEAKAVSPVTERAYAFQCEAFRSKYANEPVELCSVDFPSGLLADETRLKTLLDVPGLEPDHIYGLSRNSPYIDKNKVKRAPSKGFALGEQEWDGMSVNEMVFVNTWKDEESEREFKQSEKFRGGKFVYEEWTKQMKENGAIGWRSEHSTPVRVPSCLIN